MARQKQRGGTRLPARVAQDYAALDRVLDRMETAMLAGQPAEAQAILETVWKQRRQMPEVLTRRLIEGRAGIPFLAFRGAVPGKATGPHIHIGFPSHRFR